MASADQDEDHLEEKDNNKIEEPVVTEKLTVKSSIDVIKMSEELEAAAVHDKHNEEFRNNIDKDSADVVTIDE